MTLRAGLRSTEITLRHHGKFLDSSPCASYALLGCRGDPWSHFAEDGA
jgi:hypothetical protein